MLVVVLRHTPSIHGGRAGKSLEGGVDFGSGELWAPLAPTRNYAIKSATTFTASSLVMQGVGVGGSDWS